jgi:nitrogen fixation NifU-like protein
MSSRFYSKKTLDLFLNPPNVGSIEAPDGVGDAVSSTCGDKVEISVRLVAGKLSDVRFRTQGCSAAVAGAAAVTLLARGKTPQDAMSIDIDAVVDFLEGLPPSKRDCAACAPAALRKALAACPPAAPVQGPGKRARKGA